LEEQVRFGKGAIRPVVNSQIELIGPADMKDRFRVVLRNDGLAVAQIKRMRVVLGGQEFSANWMEVLERLKMPFETPEVFYASEGDFWLREGESADLGGGAA
jgi:hypothetical protein